jgi:DNA processing protein
MDRLLPWFSLKSVPGVGNHIFKLLIDRFGSPETVFKSTFTEIADVDGVNSKTASAILNFKTLSKNKNEIDLIKKKNYRIITLTDPLYPSLLSQIHDPPPFLYVHGTIDRSIKKIAIVGSRKATAYGVTITKRLAQELVSRKITIISGMALGIDTAAHLGALAGHGKTIAVLGSGLEKIYPQKNRKLFHKISANGAVISEFPLHAEPEPHNFPKGNRVISGISLGTIIVEAADKSGSLITARLAAEQNREVFAVPGNINSFKSKGTHRLIKQGAKLVENADDVLEEFRYIFNMDDKKKGTESRPIERIPELSDDEDKIYRVLGPYPTHIDEIVRKLSMETGKISSMLLQMELKGIIQQFPGKFFSLKI